MANARFVSNKIWRTVVVAGAMLGTPVIAACGGGQKPAVAPVGPTSDPNPTGGDVATDPAKVPADEAKLAADKAAADEKAAAEAKAAEDARLLAEKEAADAAAKEAADKAAAEEAAKKRPRGGGQKPVGRGFVLA